MHTSNSDKLRIVCVNLGFDFCTRIAIGMSFANYVFQTILGSNARPCISYSNEVSGIFWRITDNSNHTLMQKHS